MMKLITRACKLLVSLAVICILPFCDSTNTQNSISETIHIDLNPRNLPQFSKLSDVVESVRIIPLETQEDAVIGNIRKSFCGKNYMVFVSYSGSIDIHLFTSDGKFVRKIGKNGPGPGEYVMVENLSVLEDEQLIIVQDQVGRPTIAYSFTGEVEKTFDPPFATIKLAMLDQNHYAATSYSDNELIIVDVKNSDTLDFIPIIGDNYSSEPTISGNPQQGFFYSGQGRDSIFKLSIQGIEPVVGFDFGEGHFSGKELREFAMRWPADKLSILFGVFQAGDYYHATLHHTHNPSPPTVYSIFINRLSQQYCLVNAHEEQDDVLFCLSMYFSAVSPEGELVTTVDAIDLIEALPLITNNEDLKYSKQLVSQIKMLNEEDNPIIVLLKLK